MATSDDAKKVADAKAGSILLNDYKVETKEDPKSWVFTYARRGRTIGGGFSITVSKANLEVTDVLRFQ